ncbi:MAG: helix-hairpin-helix domain-containing protein [Methanobrevibacter sp.]|nr:helix-hairpin-helix domain-containing protein [Methanobrevibacter sp.]
MIVKIDNRENSRHCEAIKQYKNNHKIIIEELPIGDFIFTDKNTEVVFEYKTYNDFKNSVREGRVFDQAIRQYKNFDYHFIIIQLEKNNKHDLFNNEHHCEAIAHLNTFTTVIICSSKKLAFKMMEKQAESCIEKHPLTKKPHEKSDNVAYNYLMLINGINNIKAHAICKHLNLKTFEDLRSITAKKLIKVPGIGSITALKITKSIQIN